MVISNSDGEGQDSPSVVGEGKHDCEKGDQAEEVSDR